jgi:hypothetical protein
MKTIKSSIHEKYLCNCAQLFFNDWGIEGEEMGVIINALAQKPL